MNDFLEIKRHKNKPEQQFNCTLLHRETGYTVLGYRSSKPGLISDIHIPPGSITIAHYRQNRSYVTWRMFDSNNCLLGTLFHICTNVSILEDHLSYEDLLLDIWIAPDNSIRILDEDELQACITNSMITDLELKLIRTAERSIIAGHEKIIAECAAFEKNFNYPQSLPSS